MEIRDTRILITGANRGIGRAVSKRLAVDQCHLILIVRKSDPELENEMRAAGAKSVQVFEVDLSRKESVADFARANADLQVDILFNNAGVLTGGLFEEQDLPAVYDLIQVNIVSLMYLTSLFLPGMIQRKRGKIINHSSVSALMHFPCAAAYSASKAAVYAFTECLRQELAGTGVNTLTLVTPAIKTRMFDQVDEMYSKHFEIPKESMSPIRYAEVIRDSILHDEIVLNPSGLTGFGLKVAKYLPKVFEFEVRRRFKR